MAERNTGNGQGRMGGTPADRKKKRLAKRRLKQAAFLLLAALAAGGLSVWFSKGLELNHVELTAMKGGRLYGIDLDGGEYHIFESDPDGKNARFITMARFDQDEGSLTEITDFEPEEGGTILSLTERKIYGRDGGRQVKTAVCDFRTGRVSDWEGQEGVPEEGQAPAVFSSGEGLSRQVGRETVWSVRPDGSVWEYRENAEPVCLFKNDGTQGVPGKRNAAYSFGADGLYFYNTESAARYCLSYAERGEAKRLFSSPAESDFKNLGYVYQMEEAQDGRFTASFYQPDGRLLPAVPGEGTGVIGELSLPWQETARRGLLAGAAAAAAAAAAMALAGCVRRKVKGTFPAVAQILLLAVPVAAGGFLLLDNRLTDFLGSRAQKQEWMQLYYGAQSAAWRLEQGISGDGDFGREEILAVLDGFEKNRLTEEEVSEVRGDETEKVPASYTIFQFFLFENQEFSLAEEGMISCAPSAYSLGPAQRDRLWECAARKVPVFTEEENGKEGGSQAVYYPVSGADGRTEGVVRAACPDYFTRQTARERSRGLLILLGLFLAGMLAVLTAACAVSLRRLGGLKRAIQAVTRGERGVRLFGKGSSELCEMGRIFNRMESSLEERLKETRRLKEAYEPYIPQELIALFGKEDIRSLHPGDETAVQAAILVIDAAQFKEAAAGADVHELFLFMDQALAALMKTAEAEGGIIGRFTDVGMTVFFRNGGEAAVSVAVCAMKALEQIPGSLGGRLVRFGAGLVTGEIRLGVIGTEERMAVTALSGDSALAGCLKDISCRLETGVLIEERAAARIRGLAGRASCRLFCMIGIAQDGSVFGEFMNRDDVKRLTEQEKAGKRAAGMRLWAVYEECSGLSGEQRRLRILTKADFEDGAQLFAAGEYRAARERFIEVLKKNQDDLAAGKYFRLCDERMER